MRKGTPLFSGWLMDRAVYPLDTVKTRLQALPNDERPANTVSEVRGGSLHAKLLRRLKRWEMLQMLLRIIKSEGFAGVFKGFSANMINTFSQRMSSFLFYSAERQI
jgi:adenine nucleotide transporter 17